MFYVIHLHWLEKKKSLARSSQAQNFGLGELTTVQRLKADVSSVSPSSDQSESRNCGSLGLYGEWWSYAIGSNMTT